MGHVTTLTGEAHDLPVVAEVLRSLGFAAPRPVRRTRTLLDTHDGRLHRRGLRLEVRELPRRALVLSGIGVVTATAEVDAAPRFVADLPPGPFRARLAPIVDVRALLPIVAVRGRVTEAVRRDGRDKTVAIVRVHDGLQSLDGRPVAAPPAIVEVDTVDGYEKHARDTVRRLERAGLRIARPESNGWADALTVVADALGVDLAGVRSVPWVPLTAGTDATAAFALVLANLETAIEANRQGSIDETDTEFLHELRVAVRRSRSVLKNEQGALPDDAVLAGGALLRRLSDVTGPARDLDVQLLEWPRLVAALGGDLAADLEPLHALVIERHREAHLALAATLRDPSVTGALVDWRDRLAALAHETTLVDLDVVPIGPAIATRIDKAHRRLVERGRLIDDASPAEQVHDLRKDAKVLRYLIECFAALLEETPRKDFLRRLKPLQETLGEHQDADVQRQELTARAEALHDRKVAPAALLALGRLAVLLEQRRDVARSEFAARFAELDTKAARRELADALRGTTP